MDVGPPPAAEMTDAVTALALVGLLGGLAVLATPRVRRLAGEHSDSAWVRRRSHVVFAVVGGAGVGLLPFSALETAVYAVLALASALLVTVDLADHRLPNAIVYPTAVVVTVGWAVAALTGSGEWGDFVRALLAAVAVGGGFTVLCVLAPSGLGFGDAKLGALLALGLGWLGWTCVWTGLILAFFGGGLFALTLIVARRATRHTAVAFGPWLILGAALALALPPSIV